MLIANNDIPRAGRVETSLINHDPEFELVQILHFKASGKTLNPRTYEYVSISQMFH